MMKNKEQTVAKGIAALRGLYQSAIGKNDEIKRMGIE